MVLRPHAVAPVWIQAGLGVVVVAVAAVVAPAVAPVAVAPVAHAGRADYVGVRGCASCHQEAYEIWQRSAHARAEQSLGPEPQGPCLACHTTGEAPAGRPFFGGVTCEACHGPGAGYAAPDIMRNPTLARALGLRDLSTPARRAALCAECHRARTRLAPFDPQTAYQRIQHR